jgi:hypothetical protein
MASDKCAYACNVIDRIWLDPILFKKAQIREVNSHELH